MSDEVDEIVAEEVSEDTEIPTLNVAGVPTNAKYTNAGGPDADLVDVAEDGTLTFKDIPDFESPVDEDGNNVASGQRCTCGNHFLFLFLFENSVVLIRKRFLINPLPP